MRIGIEGTGRWLWEFPGSERELWGEWADRFAPLHLDPTWSAEPREFLGRVRPVDQLPTDLDGLIVFGKRPRLEVGNDTAYAGQAKRRGMPNHPVFGPLERHIDTCPHEVKRDRLVSLRLPHTLKRSVAKAALAHPALRSLRSLELTPIPRLTPEDMLAALIRGGILPKLKRLRWVGNLDRDRWDALQALMPKLEHLDLGPGAAVTFPPPPLRRLTAGRVDAGEVELGPADLSLASFDASTEPGWWHHVETLRLTHLPCRRTTLGALARLAAPERLRALRLAETAPLSLIAPAVVALFEAWPQLKLLTLDGRPVTRGQVKALGAVPDQMPIWTPDALRAALEPLGFTLRQPLGEDRVAALEEDLGVELPRDFRTFVLAFGDGGAGPGYGLSGVLDREHRRGRPHLPFDPTKPRHRRDGTLHLCDHDNGMTSLLVLSGPDAGTVWFDDPGDSRELAPHELPDGCELSFREWYLDWLEVTLRETMER